jgi:16S rRNA (guanine966-N2)-methyltransferase
MGLRIVGGRLGGRLIEAPRGSATRPTSDRLREALFNLLLARQEPPAALLDLYAGSGAVGLEGLSRGVARAVLVEVHGPTAALIRRNAASLGLRPEVHAQRVLDWLRRASGQRFGWVFVDPPYADAAREVPSVLALLVERGLLAEEARVVVEHDARTSLEAPPGLSLFERRAYGQSALTILTPEGAGDRPPIEETEAASTQTPTGELDRC